MWDTGMYEKRRKTPENTEIRKISFIFFIPCDRLEIKFSPTSYIKIIGGKGVGERGWWVGGERIRL